MAMGPPPITQAYYLLEPFSWCQVQFVFAHELAREQKGIKSWAAYKESGEVVEALKKGAQPLSLEAREGELNWPTVICAANAYAHMPAEERAKVRKNIENGAPIFMVLAIDDPDLCELKVLDDPEYKPDPWCLPKEAASAFEMAASSMIWTFGLIFAFRGLSARL
jgi:hypothetical protein